MISSSAHLLLKTSVVARMKLRRGSARGEFILSGYDSFYERSEAPNSGNYRPRLRRLALGYGRR